jgi:hypothetical protein
MAVELPPDPVPPYLSPGDIAAACRLSWKSVLTELKGAARAEEARLNPVKAAKLGASWRSSRLLEYRPGPGKDGSGGRWRVSASRLQELLPDMYDRVYAHYSRHVGHRAVSLPNAPVLSRSRRS